MSASPATSLDAAHKLLRTAMLRKKPIAAFYADRRRLLCPYVLGRNKQNDLRVLCYQYSGSSGSGWRCIAVEKLSDVEIVDGPWLGAARHTRAQSCIEHVELDAEKPPFLV